MKTQRCYKVSVKHIEIIGKEEKEPGRADMDLYGKYREEVNSHPRNKSTLNAVRKVLGDELSWASPLVQLIFMIMF